MAASAPTDLEALVAALDRAIDAAPPIDPPSIAGNLARLQALLSARLLRETLGTASPASATASLDDLRHLTPAEVGELLNVKPAYVHELCRTHRLPAIKSGKYWMIPLAGLRQWLAYPKRDVDPRAAGV